MSLLYPFRHDSHGLCTHHAGLIDKVEVCILVMALKISGVVIFEVLGKEPFPRAVNLREAAVPLNCVSSNALRGDCCRCHDHDEVVAGELPDLS